MSRAYMVFGLGVVLLTVISGCADGCATRAQSERSSSRSSSPAPSAGGLDSDLCTWREATLGDVVTTVVTHRYFEVTIPVFLKQIEHRKCALDSPYLEVGFLMYEDRPAQVAFTVDDISVASKRPLPNEPMKRLQFMASNVSGGQNSIEGLDAKIPFFCNTAVVDMQGKPTDANGVRRVQCHSSFSSPNRVFDVHVSGARLAPGHELDDFFTLFQFGTERFVARQAK